MKPLLDVLKVLMDIPIRGEIDKLYRKIVT